VTIEEVMELEMKVKENYLGRKKKLLEDRAKKRKEGEGFPSLSSPSLLFPFGSAPFFMQAKKN